MNGSIPNYESIPIVVVLWEKKNFQGRKVYVVKDTPDLAIQAFAKEASALGIHKGPNFDPSAQYAVELFAATGYSQDSYIDTLYGPGQYPDLAKFKAADTIASIRIKPKVAKPNPITKIPVVVELISEDAKNKVHTVVIVENVADLPEHIDHYGEGDAAGSLCDVKVYKGPNWVPGAKASFYRKTGYTELIAQMGVGDKAPLAILGTCGGNPENWIFSIKVT